MIPNGPWWLLTSLFQALASGTPVETQDVRKHPVSGWFYMDMWWHAEIEATGGRLTLGGCPGPE
jgi:hypothetical protein